MSGDRDVFLRAIDVLEERGWHQGNYAAAYGDDAQPAADSPVCIIAAVSLAMGVLVGDYLPHAIVGRALGIGPGWNDDPSRTYEDVILALKRAAHGEAAP